MKIAVDLNGGDKAPGEILKGCFEFSELHPEHRLILCSDKETELPALPDNITAEYFSYSIGMKESPVQSLKDKPDNTIAGTLKLVLTDKADCTFSCGNSGAVILNAIDVFGLKDPKINPSLISFIPMYNRKPLAFFDVGALGNFHFNADLYLEILKDVKALYTIVCGVEDPSVGLLNIGSEPWKGTSEHRKLYQTLSSGNFNFKGNIEGDSLLKTECGIVITGGFTGNVVLKLLESFGDILNEFQKYKCCNSENNYINFLMENFNYETIGGAPLIGVNGKVVIGHGKSTAKAVVSGLDLCVKYAEL
ncbi:MAG TPA: hypothetical protein PLK90_07900 [Clostridiales bacterium]|jgi:phosphate acyltransferase|nr:hypothetical protein [Clostridiales bacterium]HQP70307.1 hypothetical protein [Clostridiales bacterium]